jgi:hypothetical protein
MGLDLAQSEAVGLVTVKSRRCGAKARCTSVTGRQ